MAFWQAYYRLEPQGDEWLQTGVLAREIRDSGELTRAAIFATGGVEYEPQLSTAGQFMPGGKKSKKKVAKRRRAMTPEESAARWSARHG